MGLTIYDIAEKAGVSPATVSKVINNKGKISEKTRKKIQDIIEKENYIPNAVAQNLSSGMSKLLLYIVPDIENPFFAKILLGMTKRAEELGYSILLNGTGEDKEREHSILKKLDTNLVNGVFISIVEDNDKISIKELKRLNSLNIPVVLIDRDIEGERFDGVFSNDTEGAQEAVRCLIQAGHRRIGIITGVEHSLPSHTRYTGYKKALEEAGIPYDENLVANGHFSESGAYEAMGHLMTQSERPTAVFASNNLSTLGCLHYMNDHGIRLGKDISLVSFDEIPELLYAGIRLTVVDRPIREMGEEGMSIMYQRISDYRDHADGKSPYDNKVVRRSFIRSDLIVRGSEKLEKLK